MEGSERRMRDVERKTRDLERMYVSSASIFPLSDRMLNPERSLGSV